MPVRESAAPRAAVTAAFKQTSQPEFRRPHAGDAWQRQFGNRATGLLLQAKLRIGEPNDRYEQEADRVSDIVMRTPEPVGWDPEAYTLSLHDALPI